jgi:hypothetical protein
MQYFCSLRNKVLETDTNQTKYINSTKQFGLTKRQSLKTIVSLLIIWGFNQRDQQENINKKDLVADSKTFKWQKNWLPFLHLLIFTPLTLS